MIAERTSSAQVSGTLTGDAIKMDFDPGSLNHLMSVMTNLYSDPEMAVIREYSTNGRDATIEAGSTRPIEVTTPTPLSPFLKVRDYGVGLSVPDIHNIYSKYGASTKRNTNEQTGMLGLGSKSALAYCSQFTVISVHQGVRVQIVVGLDDEGAGTMTVVDTSATSDPSGTEVVIPARRVNALGTKARTLFSFWPEGSVILDGEAPDRVDGRWLTEKPVQTTIKLRDDADAVDVTIEAMVLQPNQRQSYIVMGGVPYPVEQDALNCGLGYTTGLTTFVSIGDIHFAPNREALRMTDQTKATLKAIQETFMAEAQAAIQRMIDQAPTPNAALKAMFTIHREFPASVRAENYVYRGRDLPSQFKVPGTDASGHDRKLVVLDKHPSRLNRHGFIEHVSAEAAADAVWFYGFDYDEEAFTSSKRKKLDHWCEANNINVYAWQADNKTITTAERFILVKSKPDMTYLDPARVKPWQPIREVKLPRSVGARQGASGRIPGSYDMWVSGRKQYGVPADDIDTSSPVYYAVTTWETTSRDQIKLLTHYDEDCTIVELISTRVDKFMRFFPNAERASAACKRLEQEWIDTIPEADKELVAFHETVDRSKYNKLRKHAPFADPAIQAVIDKMDELDAADLTDVLAERSMFIYKQDLPYTWDDPVNQSNYPLCVSYYGELDGPMEHIVTYLNAAYNAGHVKTN